MVHKTVTISALAQSLCIIFSDPANQIELNTLTKIQLPKFGHTLILLFYYRLTFLLHIIYKDR